MSHPASVCSVIGPAAPELAAPAWPSVEVGQSDKAVRVSAELPGLDGKDVEVLVDDNALTIRGEKRAETEDKEPRFSERWSKPSPDRSQTGRLPSPISLAGK